MHFVYVVINVLLLAGIIFLVGRKAIAGIFHGRREKIDRELTEAETPLVLETVPPVEVPALPVDPWDRPVEQVFTEAAVYRNSSALPPA